MPNRIKIISFILITCLIFTAVVFTDGNKNKSTHSDKVAETEESAKIKDFTKTNDFVNIEEPVTTNWDVGDSEYGTPSEREAIDALTIADDRVTEYDGFIVSFKDATDKGQKYISVDTPYDVLKDYKPEEIEFIEPDYVVELSGFPNDEVPNDTEYINNRQWALDMINAKDSWFSGYSGDGILVGVMDTGLLTSHEDIKTPSHIITSVNGTVSNTTMTDISGHGTGVTGVIAATTNNSKGIASCAYESDIAAIRVFEGEYAQTSDMINALNYFTANNIKLDVLNMSLGGTGYNRSFQQVLDNLSEMGTILVAANGNDGKKGSPLEYPANYSSVIGVGSINAQGEVSSFSSCNTAVELSAPGSNIRMTGYSNNNNYVYKDGTSFSSPMVAAAAAIIKEIDPAITNEQFRTLIINTVNDAGIDGYDVGYGYGILDLNKMVNDAKNTSPSQLNPTYSINYNPGVGSISDENNIVTTYQSNNDTITLPVAIHPDKDVSFLGWCEKPDLSDTPKYNLTSNSTGNKDFYAKFDATNVLDMSYQTTAIDITRDDSKIYAKSDEIIVAKADAGVGLTITGETTEYPICFEQNDNRVLNITLKDLNMNLKDSNYIYSASAGYPEVDFKSPFILQSASTVNMTLIGDNKLVAGSNDGGITYYGNNPSLTLDGSGSLYVEGKGNFSAIGSGGLGDSRDAAIGSITINGGNIYAKSQNGTALGTDNVNSSNIYINGGFITTEGKKGISTSSKLYINGGSINADSISPGPVNTGNVPVYKVVVPLTNNGVTNYGSKIVQVPVGGTTYKAKTISSPSNNEHGTNFKNAACIYIPSGTYNTIKIGDYKEGHATVVSANPTNSQNRVYWDYKANMNYGKGKLTSGSKISITNGKPFNFSNPIPPSKMTFSGWFTETGGKGKKITAQTIVNVKESINLYAHYKSVKVGKASIKKVKNLKGKKIKVTIKKIKGVKGYQVLYATNKKLKKAKKKSTTKTTITLKKLKKGKTYYIKVRAYKRNSAGKAVYGKYSKIKKVKVKK